MKSRGVNFDNVSTKTVICNGGLNEDAASLQLGGGELIYCKNYQIFEGTQAGYISVGGYERFDGQGLASEIILGLDGGDTAREAQRSLIMEVPGEDPVLGVHTFNGDVYAFRNKVGGLTAGMYKSTATGWLEIDTSANPLLPNGRYEFYNYNFYATVATLAMLWVDGVNIPFYYDGTTVVPIVKTETEPAIHISVHVERVFLAYPLGVMEYSNVGDPLDWTTLSGEIGVGREITNFINGVGNTLIIYCDEAIKILQGTTQDDFLINTYSTTSGGYPWTAKRLYGDSYAMDDRGVVSLSAVQEFGDFGSSRISQKIQRTLQANINNITVATISRPRNQYRLFLNNNAGLYFSFFNRQLRGVTIVEFSNPVLTVSEGEDFNGNSVIYFTSNNGYVYKMDSGTSFDGELIDTRMATSFYHYGSPRNWKKFKAIALEVATQDALTLFIKEGYDYSAEGVPKDITSEKFLSAIGGVYGVGIWGELRYAYAGSVTTRNIYQIKGIGSNMNVTIATSSKVARPHTIQNFTTDFTTAGRQL